jgi:hypothetical protein
MNGRNLAILFVVVVILGAVVYFMSQDDGTDIAEPDPVASAVRAPTPQLNLVRDATINDVQRLEVTRLEDDFQVAFVRQEEGSWFQVVPTDTAVISSTMNSNVTRIINMTSQSTLPADANPLSAYGLDNSQYEFVLVTRRGEDNVRHIFTIGNITPTGNSYYAQKFGDPRIHILLSSTVDSITGLLEERPIAVPTPATPAPAG